MEDNQKSRWKILFLITFCAFNLIFVRLMLVERNLHTVLNQPVPECETAIQETIPDEQTDILPDNEIEHVRTVVEKTESKSDIFSFSIPVTASFYNTFTDSSVVADLTQKTGNRRLAELLSAHVSRNLVFSLDMRKDVYPGDKISVVFRTVSDSDRIKREDIPDEIEVLAMKYKSIRLNKEMFFYSFKSSFRKFPAFFNQNGVAVEKYLKNSPIKEWIQITSILKDRRPKHDGIDFKAPVGTPVYAPWSGRVLRTNWKTKYNGFSIEAEINTNPKTYMILLHLDKAYVKSGEYFKAGDHIADVGNTGRSFAPHLHYQLQKEPGKTRAIIDPFKFHETTEWKLPDSEKTVFEKVKNDFNSKLNN